MCRIFGCFSIEVTNRNGLDELNKMRDQLTHGCCVESVLPLLMHPPVYPDEQ